MYDADKGIRRGWYHVDLRMSPVERDKLIWQLHQQGLSLRQIAIRLGGTITYQGVSLALKRIREGRLGSDARG